MLVKGKVLSVMTAKNVSLDFSCNSLDQFASFNLLPLCPSLPSHPNTEGYLKRRAKIFLGMINHGESFPKCIGTESNVNRQIITLKGANNRLK